MKNFIYIFVIFCFFTISSSYSKTNKDNEFNSHEQDLTDEKKQALSSLLLDQELNELIDIYTNSNKETQIITINKRIKFSGITDTRLFDIVEKNMNSIPLNTVARKNTQYVSWMAQMLAFSGQEKYKDSLTHLSINALSKTTKRHAKKSLEVLPKYKKWNKVISQDLELNTINDLRKSRVINMLNAEDPTLVRAGASFVEKYFINDSTITDLVLHRLLSIYEIGTPQFNDASAWLCRVLGNTGKSKYIEPLIKIKETTKETAIKRWSKKALRNLGYK